ncbi:MAG: DUF2797 domain-containing protein [Motiliproteus sp.]
MTLQLLAEGHLQKLRIELQTPARYRLPVGDQEIELNPYLGKQIRLTFMGAINCQHCGRLTKKSFSQGFCYPCFQSLPQCDSCIMSPEKCHFHLGTCRDPQWGEQQCMQDHYVYLANSSGVKVGITRGTQIPTRWLDQGAIQALPVLKVATRYQSGLVETAFKDYVTDRTNWQAMLKNQVDLIDMHEQRVQLIEQLEPQLQTLEKRFGLQAIQRLEHSPVQDIEYPVLNYPHKVTSLSFDKTPVVEGMLQGMKGQYLILDTGVINIRKFAAYKIQFAA